MIRKPTVSVGITFLLFFLFIAGNWNIISNLNNLKNVTIENINIDGKTYALRNQKIYEGNKQLFWFIPTQRQTVKKVVRLSGFYIWNKEDPLFDSPNLNVADFKNSVDILAREQKLFLKSFNQTIPIYPQEFLAQFAKAASSNYDLLKNPSMQKATTLIIEQKNTARIYKKYVVNLMSQIPDINQPTIAVNLELNQKIVRSDLEKISNNADSIMSEINDREKCLHGNNICKRPGLSFNKPGNAPKLTSIAPSTFLGPDIAFFAVPTDNIKGPYGANTSCLGWGNNFTKPLSYFYLQKSHLTGKKDPDDFPYYNIQSATEVIFRKLQPNSVTEGESQLYDEGIKYIYNGTTSPYNCPDRTFFAEVSELDLFMTTKKPLLQDIDLPDKSYSDYEKSFFEEKYPSFQSLSHLSDIYGYIYRKMVENPNASWVKKALPYKEELLERSLSIQRKMGNLPLILNSHSMFIEGETSRQENEQRVNSNYIKEFVYTFRNFYGAMFLPFSPSVWRLNDNPEYSEKSYVTGTVDPNGAYINYSQAQKLYSQEEIFSWYLAKRRLSPFSYLSP